MGLFMIELFIACIIGSFIGSLIGNILCFKPANQAPKIYLINGEVTDKHIRELSNAGVVKDKKPDFAYFPEATNEDYRQDQIKEKPEGKIISALSSVLNAFKKK